MPLTGNEYIAIPELCANGAVKSINVLSMRERGLIEFRGDNLIEPEVRIGSKPVESFALEYMDYWIPVFKAGSGETAVSITVLAPRGHKGFLFSFDVANGKEEKVDVEITVRVRLENLVHTVNESKEIQAQRVVRKSAWEDDYLIETFIGTPFISLACMAENAEKRLSPDGFTYHFKASVESGSRYSECIFFGVAYEEVGAVTVCRDLMRWGYDRLLSSSRCWLEGHIVRCRDEKYEVLLNRNLLFALHYSLGLCFDTEELVCVTSRSPRYYVSAAFWDRDSLLWAFPAIVRSDRELARAVLDYVTGRQARNVGIHSRYIDGCVLEPGFELDELVSPIIAVGEYLRITGDWDYIQNPAFKALVKRILSTLDAWKDGESGLFATFLQPTDDMTHHPFLLYDNALVCRAFELLSLWYPEGPFAKDAAELKARVLEHFIVDGEFVWATDAKGCYDVYDEPPGSLVLLPYYGFCRKDDPVYLKTLERIRDEAYEYSFSKAPFGAIGCAHAPHPWVLSLVNEYKVFRSRDALDKLLRAEMDERIACESIDENTGLAATGYAFATCAGFLAAALMEALDD